MTGSKEQRPRGVFAAALTPLGDDLSPDHEALTAHYRRLLDQGCDGIVCLGTTGEANSLSVDERLALLEALGKTDLPGKLVVGTGCCAVPDTVRLSKKACEIGVAGVLVLPPFYYKGPSDDGLFAAYAQTIEDIGETDLKVYIYHFPKMTALDMGLGLIGRLIEAFPGTVVGLKNSSGDWGNISAMLEAFPGFDVFAGSEEFLLPTLRLGGPGCMSATVNLLAPQTAEPLRQMAGRRRGRGRLAGAPDRAAPNHQQIPADSGHEGAHGPPDGESRVGKRAPAVPALECCGYGASSRRSRGDGPRAAEGGLNVRP